MKCSVVLHIAGKLNQRLQITPLLFGSLGLERRLKMSLNADDVDVLIPKRFIQDDWGALVKLMEEEGYVIVNSEEHEFECDGIHIAFASIENLKPFADIEISNIPLLSDSGAAFYLLELSDYLKVYTASSKDGYRKNVKNKQDQKKIDLINNKMREEKV